MKTSSANFALILATIAIVAFGLGVSYTDSWVAGFVLAIVAITAVAKGRTTLATNIAKSNSGLNTNWTSPTQLNPANCACKEIPTGVSSNEIGLTVNPAYSNYPNYVGHPVTNSDVGFQNLSGWDHR